MKKMTPFTFLSRKLMLLLFAILLSFNSKSQTITTHAGPGSGPTAVLLPEGMALDNAGNLYVANSSGANILKITPGGIITVVAGTGVFGYSGDGGPATLAKLGPSHVCFDPSGNMYIADLGNNVVRKVNTGGIITTFAGMPGLNGATGDGGPATNAQIGQLYGMTTDGTNLYLSDNHNNVIRKVALAPPNYIKTIAGTAGIMGATGDGGPATAALIAKPQGIHFDNGKLYICDAYNKKVRMINASGIISTIAGTGALGSTGDGGPATAATFSTIISGVKTDGAGNIYITDKSSQVVRKINPAGIITTIAGNGSAGFSGDSGPATAARFNNPHTTEIDMCGAIYISDMTNNRIRKIPYASQPPFFTTGPVQNITVCQNSSVSINPNLKVHDDDLGQTLTWSANTTPTHGTLSGFPYSVINVSSIMTPTGMSYTPTTGYSGTDVFTIKIEDCAGAFMIATVNVVVTPLPAPIGGTPIVCAGSTITLTNSAEGGAWSSSAAGTASVGSSTGIVTGVAAGTARITYTNSCGFTTVVVTVNTGAPAPIAGTFTVCTGATTTLTDPSPAGIWSSSNSTVATVGSTTGIVGGVATGTATITYNNACGIAVRTVTVNEIPAVITGTLSACTASTTTLASTTPGGVWSSGSTSIGTINPTTGVLTGITAGTTTVTYANACGFVTSVVTVNPIPAPITGILYMCWNWGGWTLSDVVPGGTWSSSDLAIASIDPTSGVLTMPMDPWYAHIGTTIISYTLPSGCLTTAPLTRFMTEVSGAGTVCTGDATTLTGSPAGGTWSSSNPAVCTVDPTTGVVTGISPGTATIAYHYMLGCEAYMGVTVYSHPTAITGTTSIIGIPGSTSLSCSPSGGTWSSSNPSFPLVLYWGTVPYWGDLNITAAGSTTVTYTLAPGCYSSTTVTASP